MSLRDRLDKAIADGDLEAIDRLIAEQTRTARLLLGLTYSEDAHTRDVAAKGIALVGRHHPKLLANYIRRLVWAMNDESGTNAVTAPAVLLAIAEENPEALIPVIPDLIRLTGEEELNQGLAAALKTVVERCPGKLGGELERALNKQIKSCKTS